MVVLYVSPLTKHAILPYIREEFAGSSSTYNNLLGYNCVVFLEPKQVQSINYLGSLTQEIIPDDDPKLE